MTRRILASALIAGAAVGVVAVLLQFLFTLGPIMEAELYEVGVRTHFPVDGSPQSPAGHPPLFDDPVRHVATVAMTVVMTTAFALFLVAGFALAEQRGVRIGAREGLMWGIAGFVIFHLAPSAGLAPELPGTIAPELDARMAWWLATVTTTAVAIWLFATAQGALRIALGALVLLAPHLWGAPELDTHFGVAPPGLAATFAARSLAVAAATWALLGLIAGHLWSRDAGSDG